MKTSQLLAYVIKEAEKRGYEVNIEGTGIYDSNGYETHLWLSHSDWNEMEFYYYVKPKRDGYDYSITDIGLTRSELGDGWEIIKYQYTTKAEIDKYFFDNVSLEELNNHFLKMFSN